MKLCVLALDYDGTTAINDTMDSGIRVAGECLVEAGAEHAHSVLDTIRARELPLSILFNRGRLMVLPQAISKATGLREALTILRLSPRSTIGFGDAENDHELLRACEVGVAVGWGSQSLRAVVDEVVEGSGPAALVPYLQRLVTCGQLPAVRTARRKLLAVHRLEEHCRKDRDPATVPAIASAIRGRYDLTSDEAIRCAEEAR